MWSTAVKLPKVRVSSCALMAMSPEPVAGHTPHGDAWGALNNLNWRSTDIQPAHIAGFGDNVPRLAESAVCTLRGEVWSA